MRRGLSRCVSLSCSEVVVAESVVVIKKLLQLQPKENKDLIVQVAKLMDTVAVSHCRHHPCIP